MRHMELSGHIHEIKIQSEFGIFAYEKILQTLELEIDDGISVELFYVHAFLSHVANVSKLLDTRSNTKISGVRRGELLRQVLSVPDNYLLHDRKIRNHLEHFDERIDQYMVNVDKVVVSYLLGKGEIYDADGKPFDKKYIFRHLDPYSLSFYFRGEQYDLSQVAEELSTIYTNAVHWLEQSLEEL